MKARDRIQAERARINAEHMAKEAEERAAMAQRLPSFLEALTKLSQEHGVQIGGCGCCGSPFLSLISDDQRNGHYTHHDGDDLSWEIVNAE